jgi:uracil-DNA glycosylase family 4
MSSPLPGLERLARSIVACNACPRLRAHCLRIARERKAAYAGEIYWGKPVPGFGDPAARLLIVGLAPAAHGANRTGRLFTGDRSGDWLFRALHKAGFASAPVSRRRDDGLRLKDAYITSVLRCAPPDNRPSPPELARCGPFLGRELQLLARTRVVLCLGRIALGGFWNALHALRNLDEPKRGALPRFGHGLEHSLPFWGRAGEPPRRLLLSYHPSQQNTFTGRLTETMLDSVLARAKELL